MQLFSSAPRSQPAHGKVRLYLMRCLLTMGLGRFWKRSFCRTMPTTAYSVPTPPSCSCPLPPGDGLASPALLLSTLSGVGVAVRAAGNAGGIRGMEWNCEMSEWNARICQNRLLNYRGHTNSRTRGQACSFPNTSKALYRPLATVKAED